jgi:5,5'-dehydrodivanillate O-demethylase
VMDRSKEKLGRTDTPIILLRRQFEQQIRVVEDGGEPMNVFRDADAMPEMMHGGHWDENEWVERGGIGGFREAYHKGYGIDDGDRYGPMMPQIIEMMHAPLFCVNAVEEGEQKGNMGKLGGSCRP